jgi:hypothetical protein
MQQAEPFQDRIGKEAERRLRPRRPKIKRVLQIEIVNYGMLTTKEKYLLYTKSKLGLGITKDK